MSISNNLTVGVEVEYPVSQEHHPTMSRPAFGSFDLHSDLERDFGHRLHNGGEITYDGTVGLEVVSDRLDVDRAAQWYGETLYEVSKYKSHEPTGSLTGRGSTAGLHIHLSELSPEKARELARISREPFMQVFACTSLTENRTMSLFRGDNYCYIDEFDSGRYSVVHSCAGTGHWEWRLPEPMTEEHFALLMEFLSRFKDDTADAARWVRELVEAGDDRLTSVKRAKAIGIEPTKDDDDDDEPEQPDHNVSRTFSDASGEAADFYHDVERDSHMPYIYRVSDPEGDLYAFYSNNYNPAEQFHVSLPNSIIEFQTDSVLRCKDLEEASPERREPARDAVEQHRASPHSNTVAKSETVSLVESIISE